MHEVLEGHLIAGKYRVERVLGVGGMGTVVAARHLQLDERVAIKFMLPGMASDGQAVARFAREARAAVRIKSEHVARVLDVGQLESGAPFLVMEYLDGSDLHAWIHQHGRLASEQAVEFLLQTAEALAEAHALGIVHRDLKPANLFIIRRPDGSLSVKVLDFGISKLTSASGTVADFEMTKTSAVMGSPSYMSPEQMRSSRDVDARCDIWALGVILYELLAAAPPFAAITYAELVLKIATEPPIPLSSRVADAPPALEQVILRCLEKEPRHRYGTIGELAAALIPFAPKRARLSMERISGVLAAAGMSPGAVTLPPPTDAIAADVGTAAAWGKTASPRPHGRRAVFAVAALLGIGALGAARHALHPQPGPAAVSAAAGRIKAVAAAAQTKFPSSPRVAKAPSPTVGERLAEPKDRSADAVASPVTPQVPLPSPPVARHQTTRAGALGTASAQTPPLASMPPSPSASPEPKALSRSVFDERR